VPTPGLKFGIVQGSSYADLRRESAEALAALDFPGYAIGGVSVGEPEPEMFAAIENAEPYLPWTNRATPWASARRRRCSRWSRAAWICFDCVLPTRIARNGTAFTRTGTIALKNAGYAKDSGPIETAATCPACRTFTRGYLRHLVKAEEILGPAHDHAAQPPLLPEPHGEARARIEAGTFDPWRREFVAGYRVHNAPADD
jgi:queuine tRNA-ribosyltransferase